MMLRAIMIDLLEPEKDIMVVSTTTERDQCLGKARATGAEIILVQDDVDKAASCLDLILDEPAFALCAVSADGQSAAKISIGRRPMEFDASSSSALADAIRSITAELRAAVLERESEGSEVQSPQPDAGSRLAGEAERNSGGAS